jgi:DNA adenine methylase
MREKPIRPAFGSPGGKTYLAPRIVGMIPPHDTYVEPFAGGAAVYFRKPPSEKEVLNDKDKDIAFAFRFLHNMTPNQFLELRKFNWVKTERQFDKVKAIQPENDLQRFYRFYYLKKASWGCGGKSFSHLNAGESVNIDRLWKIHLRLQRSRIHGTDALRLIDKYDSPNTFFYLDPPYPGRAFIGADFSYGVDDLRRLLLKLKGIKGKFLLSLGTEHQCLLPTNWNVKRLMVRRGIPQGDGEFNRTFQYEIIASNYPLNEHKPTLQAQFDRARGRPRITKEVIEEPLVINPTNSKMPKEVAAAIGSVKASVTPDGRVKLRVRRL